MTIYAALDTSGKVLGFLPVTAGTIPVNESGRTYVPIPGKTDVSWPPASVPGMELTAPNGVLTWTDVRTLASAKALKNTAINEARLVANLGSFVFAGKQIACDQLSRSDIDGVNGLVTLTGTLPNGWPGAWKAIDNSYVPIPDVPTWRSFYAAMVSRGLQNFASSQIKKQELANAATLTAVDAISLSFS